MFSFNFISIFKTVSYCGFLVDYRNREIKKQENGFGQGVSKIRLKDSIFPTKIIALKLQVAACKIRPRI